MSRGTVKWFDDQKGYGFISDGGGNDALVHYSGLKMDESKTLEEGAKVEYDIVDGVKGPQVTNALATEQIGPPVGNGYP